MTTSIVVVTYNSADVIADCLQSCPALETVVVDNASSDTTLDQVARFPHVRVIANTENRGFASAVNQAVQRLQTDLILLLNPDVRLRTAIEPLAEACQNPQTVAAAGLLLNPDGSPQRGFSFRCLPTPAALAFEVLGINRFWPSNPVNVRYRCLNADLVQPADIEQPAGAFFLFRRSLWLQLGGFDTQFHPIWFEDVDFCLRIRALGYKIRYVPHVTATHLGGSSILSLTWGIREVYWYASLLRYASKHFDPWSLRGVAVSVVLGSVGRGFFGVRGGSVADRFSTCAKIVSFAMSVAVYGGIPEQQSSLRKMNVTPRK